MNLVLDLKQHWCHTIVKERKKRQEILLMGRRALLVTLGRIIQRGCVVPCRITVKFSVDSSTIVVHFHRNVFGGQRQSPPTIFASSKKIKRWRPNPTAEPEVPAVHPLRHRPSARKSRLHPSLRLFHVEPCCPLPAGSIRCPTISGCTRFFNRFWI